MIVISMCHFNIILFLFMDIFGLITSFMRKIWLNNFFLIRSISYIFAFTILSNNHKIWNWKFWARIKMLNCLFFIVYRRMIRRCISCSRIIFWFTLWFFTFQLWHFIAVRNFSRIFTIILVEVKVHITKNLRLRRSRIS